MGTDQTLSDFDQMQLHSESYSEIAYIIRTKKIPNALLFSGNPNTGKKKAAFWFAKGSNCLDTDNPACGKCTPCRKIDARTHPDMLYIDLLDDKKNITISQIRQMGLTVSSRPNEAAFRMVLINRAHRMNTQAQNALLKLLEEPPNNTFFVLICNSTAQLLPTIMSRCRHIRFKPLTDQQVQDWLADKFKVDPAFAHIVSRTCSSDIKKAAKWLSQKDDPGAAKWEKKRTYILDTLVNIILSDPLKSIQPALIMSQTLCKNPEDMDFAIAVVRTFLRDLLIFRQDPKKIVNLDFSGAFADINSKRVAQHYFEWIRLWFESELKLASNCTPRLTLDNFFLQLAYKKRKACI